MCDTYPNSPKKMDRTQTTYLGFLQLSMLMRLTPLPRPVGKTGLKVRADSMARDIMQESTRKQPFNCKKHHCIY